MEENAKLVIDEWGCWHPDGSGPSKGENLFEQQSTMRDAMVTALTLNIFNNHCDKISMANIAQTVNVLQSVALTDGEEMLLTPTYYVFKMYKDHQENTLLGSFLTTPDLGDRSKTPQLIESASVKEDGTIISTIVNTSLTESAEILCQVADFKVSDITAEILTGEVHAHNTFDNKNAVSTCAFDGFETTADGFKTVIPPCSVVKFVIR